MCSTPRGVDGIHKAHLEANDAAKQPDGWVGDEDRELYFVPRETRVVCFIPFVLVVGEPRKPSEKNMWKSSWIIYLSKGRNNHGSVNNEVVVTFEI